MTIHTKDGQPFRVKVPTFFKWVPYHAKSTQWKKGIKGRYQECDEYGKWSNSGWSEHAIHQMMGPDK